VFDGTIWPPAVSTTGTFIGTPILGLALNDGTKPFFGALVLSSIDNVDVNTGTAPDEVALRFALPFPAVVTGMTWHGYNTAGSDYDAILYDMADTVLASVSMNGNHCSIVSGVDSNPQGTRCLFFEDEPLLLDANTPYRLAIKPTAANTLGVYSLTVPSAADFDAWPFKQSWYKSHRTDGGSWTDTTTTRPAMGLLVSGLSEDTTVLFVGGPG
jgi:hypothetical protein